MCPWYFYLVCDSLGLGHHFGGHSIVCIHPFLEPCLQDYLAHSGSVFDGHECMAQQVTCVTSQPVDCITEGDGLLSVMVGLSGEVNSS